MKSVGTLSTITAENGVSDATAFGPIVADRIARIRERLACGHYPLDVITLADALVGHQNRERAVAAIARPSPSVEMAVAERLVAAMRRMDVGAMLVLQLEFIEQLQGAEIAALFGTDVEAIGAMRRSALIELSQRLSAL